MLASSAYLQHAPSDFIDGAFRALSGDAITTRDPANPTNIVWQGSPVAAHAEDAVAAARRALPAWSALSLDERRVFLERWRETCVKHAARLAAAIAREIGKVKWEAELEAKIVAAKVTITLEERVVARVAGFEVAAGAGKTGICSFKPHGVMAVLGPYNFPAHLPNGHIVPALLLGNTIVFKPSEKAPATAVWMARCFDEAGFPPGSFQVVQGIDDVAAALVAHHGVDGVLFRGAVATGRKILAATAHTPGKFVQLELGGKNASIVLDDCDLERTVRDLAFSAYATAGQRCTATSRVIVQRGLADRLCARLKDAAERVVVGHPLDPGVFMGPVISDASRINLIAAQESARAAGFEALAPGGVFEVPGRRGWYVRPAVHRAPADTYYAAGYTSAELFGPDLAVHVVSDAAEALAVANDSSFGLACSVYTASRERFEELADDLEVGLVHWNRASAGASGRLPFGGLKNSGNHRPAGLLAASQCVYPLAVLLPPAEPGPLPTWPGLALD